MSQIAISEVRPQWQQELAQACSDPVELGQLLQLPEHFIQQNLAARQLFPMRVPHHFISLMHKGDIADPLLRQVLPLADEFVQKPGFTEDPLLEQDSELPGLLHKYKSRVLVVFRGGCAINCRYCFRRHFPYQQHSFGREQQQQALDYISQHTELNEVILSGGDPLMASDKHILAFAKACADVPHIKRLRIHSRLPVVIPSRLQSALAAQLVQTGLKIILVIHANHPAEISPALAVGLNSWREAGVTLLNQSVLLAGVNDSAATLIELSEALFSAHTLPYYLHQLDAVAGASHFAVSDTNALQLVTQLRNELPGFLVPKLVRECAGEASKTPLL
ncbi:MAG: EF-P beta-lysylation protein EpmB [Idiomarina sp.]